MRPLQRALLPAWVVLLATTAVWASGQVHPDAASVQPLPVGAAVPNTPLRTLDDLPTDLRTVLGESGALLVFYRGGW